MRLWNSTIPWALWTGRSSPLPLKISLPLLGDHGRIALRAAWNLSLKIHLCYTLYCQADKQGHLSVQPKQGKNSPCSRRTSLICWKNFRAWLICIIRHQGKTNKDDWVFISDLNSHKGMTQEFSLWGCLCLSIHTVLFFPSSLQSYPTLCDLIDCSLPGSSVHGILQARILEWVAMSSSRGSSWPRDRMCIS